MNRIFVIGVVTAALALCAGAADNQPHFSLALVYPSPAPAVPGRFGPSMSQSFYHEGRYDVRNATMVDLIRTAWGLDPDKVLGGPSWVEMDRFDISAVAPPDTSDATLKLMLRPLLEERFHLALHPESRDLPTYALRAEKKPLLHEADGSGEPGCKPKQSTSDAGLRLIMNGVVVPLSSDFTLTLECHNITMGDFMIALHGSIPGANLGNNPLVDETGLKGAWDFTFKYRVIRQNDGNNITIFDAMEKLGLRLEPTKAPLPVVVVDRVDRVPTPDSPDAAKGLPPRPREFDVADLKPSDLKAQDGPHLSLPGGRVEYRGWTLRSLIAEAWNVPEASIDGPKFLDSDRYTLIAKTPPEAATGPTGVAGGAAVEVMLKTLFADRFKLKVHMESRPGDRYVLTAPKPKLKAADPANRTTCKAGPGADGKDPRIANPSLNVLETCLNITMAQLVQQLPFFAGGSFGNVRGLEDKTGLTGAYDMTISFSSAGFQNRGTAVSGGGGRGRGGDGPPAGQATDPGQATDLGQANDPGQGMSLSDALEKEFGLKMTLGKRPTPFLVIDHVEQKPAEN